MTEGYDGRQVVGMDLHRWRSVLVRMTEDGRRLETVRITSSPAALRAVIARAGKNPRVVLEAAYGWYWAVDLLEAAGAEVHLAHPLGVKAYCYRRVKNGTPRTWPACCGWVGCPRRGSPRRRSASVSAGLPESGRYLGEVIMDQPWPSGQLSGQESALCPRAGLP